MAAGSDALGHFGLTREALREPDRELRRGKRLRQEVALRRVAAELDEAIPDLGRLDALGDDAEAEVAAEVDRRADDPCVLLLAVHRHHEGAIDLDLVHRQLAQVRERRVAGAEVVHGEADAGVAQALEDLLRARRVGEHARLGELELEDARVEAVAIQQPRDLGRKLVVEDVPHRDVHGDRQVEALLAPARALLERLLDDEERERPDEAGVLCDGDEDVGRDEAALRVLPADERLDAAHRAVGEPRLRLGVEHALRPSRATVSPGRTTAERRRASSFSIRSPQWWPSVSLTSLKRSRSMSRTATPLPVRPQARSAWSSRSRKSERFGRPVRWSCSARRSFSSAWRRSLREAPATRRKMLPQRSKRPPPMKA